MSCQRSDLRKTLKYSQSRDLEGIQWILWIYTDAATGYDYDTTSTYSLYHNCDSTTVGTTTQRYHDAFDYDGSDRNYDLRSIRLRYDYDTTTTYRARLFPFDATRRKQKINMPIFRRSHVVVVSQSNRTQIVISIISVVVGIIRPVRPVSAAGFPLLFFKIESFRPNSHPMKRNNIIRNWSDGNLFKLKCTYWTYLCIWKFGTLNTSLD